MTEISTIFMQLAADNYDVQALAASGNHVDKNLRLIDSQIIFKGTNNHVVTDGIVELYRSKLVFESDNALIFLAKPADAYQLEIHMGFGCTVFIHEGASFLSPLGIFVSEEANVVIGRDCLFAKYTEIWNTDLLPMWDADSGKRLNPSASVYLGDHIWLGENVRVLKGVNMGSGSMAGALAVVAHSVGPNMALGGNPARILSERICWTRQQLHTHPDFNKPEAERPQRMDPSKACFLPMLGPGTESRDREALLQDMYGMCEKMLRAGFEPAPKAEFLRNVLLPFGQD